MHFSVCMISFNNIFPKNAKAECRTVCLSEKKKTHQMLLEVIDENGELGEI